MFAYRHHPSASTFPDFSRKPDSCTDYVIELQTSRGRRRVGMKGGREKRGRRNNPVLEIRHTCYSLRVSRVPLRPTNLLLGRICIQFARNRVLLWLSLRKSQDMRFVAIIRVYGAGKRDLPPVLQLWRQECHLRGYLWEQLQPWKIGKRDENAFKLVKSPTQLVFG